MANEAASRLSNVPSLETELLGPLVPFHLPSASHTDEAHTECVYALHLDGAHAVTGSRDRSIRVWDLTTQRLARGPLLGHSASVLCLQFDPRPDHDVIVSGGADAAVIVWRFSTGELVRRVEGAHRESVLGLAFDGTWLVTASKDRSIKVWRRGLLEVDGGQGEDEMETDVDEAARWHVVTLTGHTAAVNAVQILGDQIVSGSGDRQVKVWSVPGGECLRTISTHRMGITSLQVSEQYIVSASSDRTVRVFEQSTGAEVACFQDHVNLARKVYIREESGKTVIGSAGYDGEVIFYGQDEAGRWRMLRRLALRDAASGLGLLAGKGPGVVAAAPRIFGFQFDGERIICSSEYFEIVGWQFQSTT